MASIGIWFPLIIGIIYVNFACTIPGDSFSSMEISKPQRPRVFTSPDELRNYLEAVGRYYALAGRNRYGKRALPIGSTAILTPQNNFMPEDDK